MSKILAVFGATGKQGAAIIDSVLHDPELAQKYKIRAITRDVNSEKAKQFPGSVEVVRGDANDRASLETALSGVYVVFAMTNPTFDGTDAEIQAAKAIADVAVAKSAKYIIFSTLPSISAGSSGKYTKAIHFDAKAVAEDYIRQLPIQSAFISPGMFMENFSVLPLLTPKKVSADTWALTSINAPDEELPMVDITDDLGKFVGAVLAHPDKYAGKTFCAATELRSWKDLAATMSRVTGKNIEYRQVSDDEFKQALSFGGEIFLETFRYTGEFGYWGPDSKEKVVWAVENARGKVTTFEEYLRAHPLHLT